MTSKAKRRSPKSTQKRAERKNSGRSARRRPAPKAVSNTETNAGVFAIFNSLPMPVFAFAANAPGRPLRFANVAAEHLLGIESDKAKMLTPGKLFHVDERNRIQAMISVLQTPAGESLLEENEMQAVRWSGRKVAVKVSATSLTVDSERILLFCLSDLTDIKKLQDERETTIKEITRISKLADIGQLVAGVAHELNNPLTVIQGFAENIEMLLDGTELSASEIRWQLDPILKASDRMARIISRMMRMVRQDDIRMSVVDLRDVVGDAIHFMHHRLDDFGIEVRREMPERITVNCDSNQVEQILLNLISNAVHALRKNRGTRIIRFRTEQDLNGVRIKVHNNGPAIPNEIRERIMSPFFTTKPVGQGTGLGLALSYGIMKAHGGDLRFSSTPRDGTEFILDFPLASVMEGTAPAASNRLLIVADDNEFSRKTLANKLARYGFNVLEARDGEDLILQLRGNPEIEAVFTEIYMPRTTPSRIIPEIRRLVPRAKIYVVTDTPEDGQLETSLIRQGVLGFLTKPVDQEAFAGIIRQIEKPKVA